MENFSYPIKLEPLTRPVKRRLPRRAQPATRAAEARATRTPPQRIRPARPARRQPPLELQEARERNGVTLEAIAEHTRIPLRHLQELERGDVSHWPPGIYAKSWARDYAKEAGIDPDRVVALVSPIAEVEPSIDEIREVREEAERTRVDESPLTALVALARRFAAVIVVLLLMVIAAIYFTRGDSQPGATAAPAPVGTTGATPSQPPR